MADFLIVDNPNRKNPKILQMMIERYHEDPLLQDMLGFNEFLWTFQFVKDFEAVKAGEVFEDRHVALLKWYFVRKCNLQPNDGLIIQFMELVSYEKPFHPIKAWLNGLKWDGLCRLDSWLTVYAGVEMNVYTSRIGAMCLVAAIARVFKPGTKYDYMLILEGPQGIMKSTLFEVLGGKWYMNISFDQHEKDIIEKMRGGWMIEIADLSGMGSREIQWLRAFLARGTDRCRLPYARTSRDFPRSSIFVGTHNPSGDNEYLLDDTGNRRFFPVECGSSINIVGLREVREQLFAEAYERYRQGFSLYLTGQPLLLANKAQADRQSGDPWEIAVRRFVHERPRTSIYEILNEGLHLDNSRISHRDKIRIGRIMRVLGWKRHQANSGEWEYLSPNVVFQEDFEANLNGSSTVDPV